MECLQRTPRDFADQPVPPGTALAGYSALVQTLDIQAPVRRPTVVSDQHVKGNVKTDGAWHIYDKRYEPGDTVADHLTFALRHEDLDLLVLKRIFQALPEATLTDFVRTTPMGIPNRRAWFLYEFLMGRALDIPDAPNVTAVEVLDSKRYYTLPGALSRRHRVRNNLLGTPAFCPVIRRTPLLETLIAEHLAIRARETVGRVSQQLIARAASFLLLADSKASFQIEGERPPRNRLERWGRAVLQAGRYPLMVDELNRLHGLLIEDTRFFRPGLRTEGVFLGERTVDGDPLPEFIGARPQDLEDLVPGLLAANEHMGAGHLDPVLQAAATAFGFVYIHPFEDGNGRLQRYLIHHVLAEQKFSPPSVVFPVSSVMLDRIDEFRRTLQAHSGALMPYIEWTPTERRNVDVLNDTADLYRYFDATGAAEFLYSCVQRTVTYDFPREIDYLHRHDEAIRAIMEIVEMPDQVAEDLLMFIRQNEGALPNRRRQREFQALTDQEVQAIENAVCEAFEGY